MLNWLNQEIEEGAVVYKGHQQGSHGNLVGIVNKDNGDGDIEVDWHFELFSLPVKIQGRFMKNERAARMVRLDDSVLASLHHPN